ncbi:serine/threonine protein phosphatase 2B catalytic subunit, putative [Entamoeba invadens IP1]|uniref:serine/threonine protein phosphatase 2B catalytic subunit, putative n=1 Tax=Entamoeba invadens IP1 TaxID=370355 RepID=UPI0002C3D06B|nr:serine/threonine protein phosphatase 2B catalytic subunit, putative [Entamoeba invadens IP1]ELP93539.1 serine/threonine protein phosphatase 2B catalytic subunit, putative [Entamoeba invadens IP1]|eukprot:XP_004260310.1 serine/threonine protein phosphatase 2B catalytic subunit, putative [Entamoeba invadens IP1]
MQFEIDIPFNTTTNKYDIEKLVFHFLQGGVVSRPTLFLLLEKCKTLFRSEKNMIEVSDDALIFGDFHGQYLDFLGELQSNKEKITTAYTTIFLGDYVDRGDMSTELLITLLCMKYNTPTTIIMLRGNHESMMMSSTMGFLQECKSKYTNTVHASFCDLFNTLPLCVLLRRKMGNFFLCHGGISPDLGLISEIDAINRFREPPNDGVFCDLLWSDPISDAFLNSRPSFKNNFDKIDFLTNTERGTSYIFGFDAIDKFLTKNQVVMLIRGHQCCQSGIDLGMYGNETMEYPLSMTIFSAIDYFQKNQGSCVLVTDDDFNIFNFNTTTKMKLNPVLANPLFSSLVSIFGNIESGLKDLIKSAFLINDIEEVDYNCTGSPHNEMELEVKEEFHSIFDQTLIQPQRIVNVPFEIKYDTLEEEEDDTQAFSLFKSFDASVGRSKHEHINLFASISTQEPTRCLFCDTILKPLG